MFPVYAHFGVSEEQLREVRHAVYHSSGPGYFILRNYIDSNFVQHIREVWTSLPEYYNHEQFTAWRDCKQHMANFEQGGNPALRLWCNFFWNPPVCDVTHAVCLAIAILRNRIEGRAPVADISGENKLAVSYVVIQTRNMELSNPWHRDWTGDNTFQPERLQATLALSNQGEDFDGPGAMFECNDGARISLFQDAGLRAGDLVFWRYSNQHAVFPVSSREDQIGCLRIIFPPQILAGHVGMADVGNPLNARSNPPASSSAPAPAPPPAAPATEGKSP